MTEETMLETVANAIEVRAEEVGLDLGPFGGEFLAKAALEAIRQPSEQFMRSMYPNPSGAFGERHGERSRRAGRQQINHLARSILQERA